MAGDRALQRLLTWLSPAFPVGGFAWSGGFEAAIAADEARSAVRAAAWPSGVFAEVPAPCPCPVAVGAVADAHRISRADATLGLLTVAVHTQISVAVRLAPQGQTAGLSVMAALEPAIAAMAAAAAAAPLSAIGSAAYGADIAQMQHETLEPRLFRS